MRLRSSRVGAWRIWRLCCNWGASTCCSASPWICCMPGPAIKKTDSKRLAQKLQGHHTGSLEIVAQRGFSHRRSRLLGKRRCFRLAIIALGSGDYGAGGSCWCCPVPRPLEAAQHQRRIQDPATVTPYDVSDLAYDRG